MLFIGIDGVRSEALKKAMATGVTPNLKYLADHGTITWNGIAGGRLSTASQQATLSGPGWASFYTGTWTDRHNVTGNGTPPYDEPGTASSYLVTQAPPFARRLVDSVPTASVASITSWNWNEDYIVAAMPSVFSYHAKGSGVNYPGRDANVKDKAVAYLSTENPDVLMLHFDQVDGAGHSTGFSSGNPNYMTALANVDAHIGDVLTTLMARPNYSAEEWLIFASTDHGGNGTSHGGQSAAERDIFILVNGPGVPAGRVTTEAVGQPALAQTIFKYLGVPVNAAWQFAERPFGLAPTAIIRGAGTRAMIEVVQPASGLVPGCTGIELWRNGVLVSTQPANVSSFTDAPALPVTGSTMYDYELRFAGTTVTPVPTSVTLTASTGADVVTDRVLWLPFDGSSSDTSGRGNHATVTGSAGYTTGRSGQALVISGSQYATLPASYTDLKFGASTNFTIAFWVQAPTQWSSDPVLISNKNWNAGTNTGWAVACQSNAGNNNTWQWNFKGATLARADFDSGGVIRDGVTWHHVAITHNRSGNAVMYADGVPIGSVSINGAGDVDTAFPIQIGRDGNGGNPLNVTMAIDDVMVWRRALTDTEVRSLVPLPSVDLVSNLVLDLPFDGSATDNSGRGNHGTLTGGSSYAAGRTGQAVVLNAAQYVTLGQPTDLQFGSATDFTLSCWVKSSGAWSGDPCIISNKNWGSGANTGWFLGGQQDATTWQWNFKGATLTRKDNDNGGSINDGGWHHILISHRRAGSAEFYHDGTLIGTVALAGAGTTDTIAPLAINIGRDGTGAAFSWSSDLLVDDLKIWRRALTSAEAAAICPPQNAAWNAWRQFYFNVAQLADSNASGPNADFDGDGVRNFLEFALGTNPLQSQEATVLASSGRGIAFELPAGGVGDPASGYRLNGLLYRVEYSPDLMPTTWVNAPLQTPVILAPGSETRFQSRCELAAPQSSAAQGFLRVKVIEE